MSRPWIGWRPRSPPPNGASVDAACSLVGGNARRTRQKHDVYRRTQPRSGAQGADRNQKDRRPVGCRSHRSLVAGYWNLYIKARDRPSHHHRVYALAVVRGWGVCCDSPNHPCGAGLALRAVAKLKGRTRLVGEHRLGCCCARDLCIEKTTSFQMVEICA